LRSSSSWWGRKVRQARAHVAARVSAADRADLAGWLTPAELALFDAMPVADRRHGLDVVNRLRDVGARDPDLLLAGLLHDCGKGPDVRLVHRVAWSLSERYGAWVLVPAAVVPGMGAGITRIRDHAEISAEMMLAAGASPRAADLARHQAAPVDPILGDLLHAADEAA
jgi:hypothetical protein